MPVVSTSQRRPETSESAFAVIAHVSRLREAIKGSQFATAVHAATDIKVLISIVVNTKQPGLKGLQQSVVASGIDNYVYLPQWESNTNLIPQAVWKILWL